MYNRRVKLGIICRVVGCSVEVEDLAVISSFESVGYPPLCPMLLRRALHLLQGGCNISSVHTDIAVTMLDVSREKLKHEVAEHRTLKYEHETLKDEYETLQYRLSREKLENRLSREKLETQLSQEKLETQRCKVELTNLKEKMAQGQ